MYLYKYRIQANQIKCIHLVFGRPTQGAIASKTKFIFLEQIFIHFLYCCLSSSEDSWDLELYELSIVDYENFE